MFDRRHQATNKPKILIRLLSYGILHGISQRHMERFWIKVKKTKSCWLWTACLVKGYGQFFFDGKRQGAHRVAYKLIVGEIPVGKQIDHLCKTPSCVNPKHLEVVSPRENTLRGTSFSAKNAKKKLCKNGHKFNSKNTRLRIRNGRETRECRVCKKLWNRKSRNSILHHGGTSPLYP